MKNLINEVVKITRKEKEEYLIITCENNGFRVDDVNFRKEVSKLSDYVLDIKIDTLIDLLEIEK